MKKPVTNDLQIRLHALNAKIDCPYCSESHVHFCGWEKEHEVFLIHDNVLKFCDRYECACSGSYYRIRSGLECGSCPRREVDCLYAPVIDVEVESSSNRNT
jgi:hypothetical protein